MKAVAPTASVAVRTLNMVLLVVAETRILLEKERKGLGTPGKQCMQPGNHGGLV